jgi:hypothetical protein
MTNNAKIGTQHTTSVGTDDSDVTPLNIMLVWKPHLKIRRQNSDWCSYDTDMNTKSLIAAARDL